MAAILSLKIIRKVLAIQNTIAYGLNTEKKFQKRDSPRRR
jgi:hypothetical protein